MYLDEINDDKINDIEVYELNSGTKDDNNYLKYIQEEAEYLRNKIKLMEQGVFDDYIISDRLRGEKDLSPAGKKDLMLIEMHIKYNNLNEIDAIKRLAREIEPTSRQNRHRYTKKLLSLVDNNRELSVVLSNKKLIKPENNRKTYLMKDSHNGLYKIGYSNNPVFRESTLQSEKPSIKMVKVWDENIEKKLHNLYSEFRIRGEWFKLSKVQIKYICTNFNN